MRYDMGFACLDQAWGPLASIKHEYSRKRGPRASVKHAAGRHTFEVTASKEA